MVGISTGSVVAVGGAEGSTGMAGISWIWLGVVSVDAVWSCVFVSVESGSTGVKEFTGINSVGFSSVGF